MNIPQFYNNNNFYGRMAANVSAVCLVESNIKIDNGKTMIATGYGKTSDSSNANFSPVLRSVSALTISNKQCSETFAIAADDDGMMCTSADGGRGVCTVKSQLIFEFL